jgi:Tol biopolymer transport system component
MNKQIYSKIFICVTLVVFMFSVFPSFLHAQYFGRNKVQYEDFDFKIIKTEHFDVYFYPEMREAAQQAARMAERWYARLSRVFNHELKGRQPLILYAASPHFQQTTAIPGVLGEGVGGVTESFKRRIVLPLGHSLAASDHVIGHELVHAFQYDITSQKHSSLGMAAPSIHRLPLWIIEGMAEYLSIGPVDSHTAMWMRDATHRDKVPHLKKLSSPEYFPYRYGHSFWAYVTGRWGDSVVPRILTGVGKTGDLEAVIKKVLGVSFDQLSKDWQDSLKKAYDPLAGKTTIQDPDSRVLIKASKENTVNLSPSISPDGKKVVFLSAKDLFSIDLFLADVETGKVEKKLVNTAINPHFESLQFIKSAGSWDSEGKYFVFAAVSKGQPMISILNVREGKIEHEYEFPHLGEILNPTWSPDGRYIAFSALEGGFSNLFIYDLREGKIRKMTDDPFAALQPAWSPDGKAIAFVTDRFSTDLSLLDIGHFELALIDPNSAEITKLPSFKGAKHINPQWTPDSKSLVFVSDRNGISNVYKLDVASEKIVQISNLYTGVSGITEESPALSVAKDTGRVAYCFYEENRYSLYFRDFTENEAAGVPLIDFNPVYPDVLPPREKSGGDLQGLLKNPIFGLPGNGSYPEEEYKPKLKLDYITPPSLGIGVDRYGTYAGGGLAMFFSDMLGHHNLSTTFTISSRLIDSSAALGYQNNKNRWNWGASLQRISYPYGGFTSSVGVVAGEPSIIEREFLFRQINYQAAAFLSYPFNQVSRVEVSGGYRFIDYDQEVRTRAYSLIDGREILKEKEKLDAPSSLTMPFMSTAWVYDTSIFGATGPVLGQSFIAQVAPLFGTINYVNILTDLRKYFMPVQPFTLAFRVLHTGRYGKGGEDSRLYPLFMGYESLVRGYSYYSFGPGELSTEDGFDVYRSLFGSKFAVVNAELRFPLFNVLGLGKGYYGILPVDFLTFFDAGVAWDSQSKPFFLGGERRPVASAGLGLRMNLFGYMIVGVNYVYPFNRPERGAYFELTFSPGF